MGGGDAAVRVNIVDTERDRGKQGCKDMAVGTKRWNLNLGTEQRSQDSWDRTVETIGTRQWTERDK